MESGKSAAVTVAVVALVVGGGVGYAIGNNGDDTTDNDDSSNSQQPASGTDTGAAELRSSLSGGMGEHVTLASSALRDLFDGAKSTDAAVAELNNNSDEVIGLVGSVYGDEAQDQFGKL